MFSFDQMPIRFQLRLIVLLKADNARREIKKENEIAKKSHVSFEQFHICYRNQLKILHSNESIISS